MLPSLAALPGVTVVGAAQKLPLRGSGDNWGIRIVGPAAAECVNGVPHGDPRLLHRDAACRSCAGATSTLSDRAGSERVVVVNEALAAKFFPGEDPIGRRLQTFDDPAK